MYNRPLVHIGLAKTATTFLQRAFFPKLSDVCYLGKNFVSDDLDRGGRSIVRRTSLTWKLADVAPAFRSALDVAAREGKRPVFSEEDLSVFKFMDPETCARRLRDILGDYDVLLVVRDPITWIQSNYHFRLSTFHPKCFWGIDYWLREHRSVVGIGSDISEIQFGQLADVYASNCGGSVSVLPYELLKLNKAEFARRLSTIVGSDLGEVQRLMDADQNRLDKGRITAAESEFIKEARLVLQREYNRFGAVIGEYCGRPGARPDMAARAEIETLISTEEDDFGRWKAPLGRLKASLSPLFANSPPAEEQVAEDLLNWLRTVARTQVRHLRANYDFDLARDGIRYAAQDSAPGSGGADAPRVRPAIAASAGAGAEARAQPSNRAEFVRAARDALHLEPSSLGARKVLELGRATGLMTAAELGLLERRNILPTWLREQLGLNQEYLPSAQFRETEVISSRRIECPPPERIGSAKLPPVFDVLEGSTPRISVVSGNSARLGIDNFLRAAFVADGFIPSMTDAGNLWAWQLQSGTPPPRLSGRTFVCVVEGSNLFSHWLLDTLPRFEVLKAVGMSVNDFDHVLIAGAGTGFQKEGLAAYGVDPQKVTTRRMIGGRVECDEFVHVTAVRNAFFADDWVYASTSAIFPPIESAGGALRKIFISRRNASRRRIINEAELEPTLSRFGFEILRAEDISVAAMARLCAAATHIVAPHGAGLANIAFMPAGGRVLELYGAHISPEYWRICCARGLRYVCMQGSDPSGAEYEQAQLERMSSVEKNSADFRIDAKSFADALAMLVEG